jgi:hypothetical protein
MRRREKTLSLRGGAAMRRVLTIAYVFVLAGCTAALSTSPGPTRGPERTPLPSATTGTGTTPPSESRLVIGPPGGPGAATNLRGESICSDEQVAHAVAQLRWTPAVDRGDEQLVQVTIYSFDLPGSTFSEPLDPDTDSLVFEQVSGQAVHQWRVLTRRGETWTPSEGAEFVGATCVVDVQP